MKFALKEISVEGYNIHATILIGWSNVIRVVIEIAVQIPAFLMHLC